jgi:hypothetical protein
MLLSWLISISLEGINSSMTQAKLNQWCKFDRPNQNRHHRICRIDESKSLHAGNTAESLEDAGSLDKTCSE